MREGTIHIVGAGLAGLCAAVHLANKGHNIALYEAATHAGGRCRSYFDKELGCVIDNGNHLMLSCNHAALEYLRIIGAADDGLLRAPAAYFPFMNLETGHRWELKMNDGVLPLWIFDKDARVPETRWHDYLEVGQLLRANRWATVADVLDNTSTLYKNFWQPLTVAIMNTKAEEASATIMGNVLREAFSKGGAGAVPMTARIGLSETFVDPALAYLKQRGALYESGQRLRGLTMRDDAVAALHFATRDIKVNKWDWLVLALPAPVVNDILPSIPTPKNFRSIVNAHFKINVPLPSGEVGGWMRFSMLGIIGSPVEWIFEKDGIVSTTTSAAEHIVDKSAEELAVLLWRDVAKVYGLNPAQLPPYRIVKEKRATFAATPDDIIRRPKIEVRHGNMVLCGDWMNTGLPSTIEGAMRSGRKAAGCIAKI